LYLSVKVTDAPCSDWAHPSGWLNAYLPETFVYGTYAVVSGMSPGVLVSGAAVTDGPVPFVCTALEVLADEDGLVPPHELNVRAPHTPSAVTVVPDSRPRGRG
jgi:hypothetical protein